MLYAVGLGAGGKTTMTPRAIEVIENCDLVVGYTTYIELIKNDFKNANFFETPMTKEVERCSFAVEKALEGLDVCVVSSGDSGVYGMASLLYELCKDYDIEIEVVCGITAAISGASLLGAPINHDFAIISLSDLLTPLNLIMKRIEACAMADMPIVIYNPSSKKRADYLKKACDIILKYQKEDTVCGYVKNISRKGEEAKVLTLSKLRDFNADMFTTVFIGNSTTINIKGKMVTPRGYKI
ncbi:MAG: precorrin-3B C(17)-methyltransferase [Lachnospirales bacterium]